MTSPSVLVRFGAFSCLCFAAFGCGSGAQTGSNGQPSTIGGGMSGSGSTATGSATTGSTTTGTTTTGSTTTGATAGTSGGGSEPGDNEAGGASTGSGGTNGGSANGGSGGDEDGCRGPRCAGGAEAGGTDAGGASTGGTISGVAGCFSDFGNGSADRIALPPCSGGAPASGGAGVGGEQAAGGGDGLADGFNACEQNEDCVIVAESCCGTCGAATPDDATAVNSDLANAYRTEVCGPATACLACAGENDPRISTLCEAGRCIVELALD